MFHVASAVNITVDLPATELTNGLPGMGATAHRYERILGVRGSLSHAG